MKYLFLHVKKAADKLSASARKLAALLRPYSIQQKIAIGLGSLLVLAAVPAVALNDSTGSNTIDGPGAASSEAAVKPQVKVDVRSSVNNDAEVKSESSASVESSTHVQTGGSSNVSIESRGGNVTPEVRINGQRMPVPKNGTVEREMSTNGNGSNMNIRIRSSNSDSDMDLDIDSKSSFEVDND